MHLDHLSYAAGPEGLDATAKRLGEQLGATFSDGGFHPRFGTRNQILPLTDGHYLEVVAVLDHPAADKASLTRRRTFIGGWAYLDEVRKLGTTGGLSQPLQPFPDRGRLAGLGRRHR